MYEEKKTAEGRSFAIRLLVDMPWVVRAFFLLLIVDLAAILLFGLGHRWTGITAFETVSLELIGYLKLIFGAIIGAFSAHAKSILDTKEQA